MAGNANYDEILSTSLANHRPKLVDNIFTAKPWFHFLKQADQIQLISGGHKIVRPVIMAENDTVGVYSNYDSFSSIAPTVEFFTSAEYDWKQVVGSVRISGLEEAKNNGPEEIIDLLDARIKVTEQSIGEFLDEKLITGGSTDWFGLDHLVAQNASAVGGINPATVGNEFWQSNIDTGAASLSLADMSNMYNTCAEGADAPNVVLTTQLLFEAYEALLQPQLRFSDSTTADAGFQNLLFKGAPVVYDQHVDATWMYFLNTRYIQLVGHKSHWFRTTSFQRPTNADYRVASILAYGQQVITNRNRQGVLKDRTA